MPDHPDSGEDKSLEPPTANSGELRANGGLGMHLLERPATPARYSSAKWRQALDHSTTSERRVDEQGRLPAAHCHKEINSKPSQAPPSVSDEEMRRNGSANLLQFPVP